MTAIDPLPPRESPTPIVDADFRRLVATQCGGLLGIAGCLAAHSEAEKLLTRPMVGKLLLEAGQAEALIDEYGARQNRRWCRFRALIAVLKNFGRMAKELAHLDRRLPAYRLLPIEPDFPAATRDCLHRVGQVLAGVSSGLLVEARELGLETSPPTAIAAFAEPLPAGRLANDRDERILVDTAATLTRLTTDFLNLEAEGAFVYASATGSPDLPPHALPSAASEETLRQLTFRFHNLQSLYDTHVAGTAVETADPDLPILRGHASVIYHLLEIATDLAHYYERHLSPATGDGILRSRPAGDVEGVVGLLFPYTMVFGGAFLASGKRLCQGILRRYAEYGRLAVPVPSYRGFHVRPSNLVARIVAHYGSGTTMELDGRVFDAGSPLDLFRANESINARKRRWLATEIARVSAARGVGAPALEPAEAVLAIVNRLAGEGKIILYRQPLELSDQVGKRDGGVFEDVVAEIAQLQATGQLDIRTDLTVTFAGDRRVLADIDLLARNGYGEDAFGNNVELPKALSYLRR
ncbi:MAG TPA: hypothetical protein PK375_04140 [Rhodocyclaceae bacterium]|nr:hypothetical protein [Rhodocyclaceae bacterium]HNH35078.1 hypothetical protein [Rhodocyclaceae bacterium]